MLVASICNRYFKRKSALSPSPSAGYTGGRPLRFQIDAVSTHATEIQASDGAST